MSTPVETIASDTTVADAKAVMKREGVHHLVVGRGSAFRGVVSARDLASADATTAVALLLARKPVTGTPRTTVREAANLLRGHNIGCLPVIDRGRVIGIITISDLLELIGKGAERPTPAPRVILKARGPRKSRPGPDGQHLQYGR